MVLRVRNCQDNDETILLDGLQWAVYSPGDVFTIVGQGDTCWEVVDLIAGEGIEDAEVAQCYSSCSDCLRTAYMLTDCTGRPQPRYTTQDFEDLVGSIVKVPYYKNACFTVSLVRYDKLTTYEEIEYSNVYNDCETCRQRKTVDPLERDLRCDRNTYDKVTSTFSEVAHQEVMSKRFGVEFCCNTDKIKWQVKKEILDFNMMKDEDPELPEPIVEECCIQVEPVCVLPQNYCADCPELTDEGFEVGCRCTASVDSPHDCHTYEVTVPQETLDLAVGNANISTNGKVYFGYIPCGETVAVTVEISNSELLTYCVLGVPIIGYYASNTWVDLSETLLTRGNVCEL